MRNETIPLHEIIRDERLRYRDPFNVLGRAEEYAEMMTESEGWGTFPRAVCMELKEPHTWTQDVEERGKVRSVRKTFPSGTVLLIGGFTRCKAADIAGVRDVPCEVHTGTWADALRLAWTENTTHGKPRSSSETESVLTMIHCDPLLAAQTEREVAKIAGCSRATVNRWRKRFQAAQQPPLLIETVDDEDVQPDAVVDATPPEPTPKAGPNPVGQVIRKDSWGRPVPIVLERVFESLPQVQREIRTLRSATLSLASMKHGPDGSEDCITPALASADVKAIASRILNDLDSLESALPAIVCPTCDGTGCMHCVTHGWLTLPQADELPPKLERKARSFQGIA